MNFKQLVAAASCAGLLFISSASAAERTWTRQTGEKFKAEFFGGSEGKVILKEKGNRRYYYLSTFSLADRDYIIDALTQRGNKALIDELVDAAREEANVPEVEVVEDQKPRRKPGSRKPRTETPSASGTGSNPPNGSSTTRKPSNVAIVAAEEVDELTEIYGVVLPTPELIALPPVRVWTDLKGKKTKARFAKVEVNGLVTLENDSRFYHDSLVNLSTPDVEAIIATLEEDSTRPIFPTDGAVELTSELSGVGFRVYTDRRGVKLVARHQNTQNGRVTLETPDGRRNPYLFAGLSAPDAAFALATPSPSYELRPSGTAPGTGPVTPNGTGGSSTASNTATGSGSTKKPATSSTATGSAPRTPRSTSSSSSEDEDESSSSATYSVADVRPTKDVVKQKRGADAEPEAFSEAPSPWIIAASLGAMLFFAVSFFRR